MQEIWKEVPDYPRYEVSNLGRVRSWATTDRNQEVLSKKPHLLKQFVQKDGYHRVSLCNKDGVWQTLVHRIVLLTFVGDCPDGMEACHNNGKRGDNRLDNLRWDTRVNNFADRDKHGRTYRGQRHHETKFTPKDIVDIRERASNGEFHRVIADDYGVTRPTISYIVNRSTWSHVP